MDIKEVKHQTRRLSIKSGIFGSAKGSFGDYYLAPFAIALNSSNFLVAMLSSVTGLLNPLGQILGSKFMRKSPRKKIVLKSFLLEGLFFLPLILIAFFFYKGLFLSILPLFFFSLFIVHTILLGIPYPPWFSWMGSVVDEKYRGRWFSKRNFILRFISVILVISSSFFLSLLKKDGKLMLGFGILFSVAIIFRFLSYFTLKKEYEPKTKFKEEDYFSFLDFLKQAPKSNFGRFSLFQAAFYFSGTIFFSILTIYLLRGLHFEYSTYMIVLLGGTFFSLFFMRFWGIISDRYGNEKIIKIAFVFLSFTPILWIFSHSPIYLFLIPSFVGGIAFTGFSLASVNFIYDNVRVDKRALAVSYSNMISGIGIFLGAGIGALIISLSKYDLLYTITLMAILSSFLRSIVAFLTIKNIKEIKQKKKLKDSKIFKEIILKSARPILTEEIHEIIAIRSYLKTENV